MPKKVIGIYSPAPQSGKTFVATVLVHSGYQPVSFAEPLKRMMVEFLMSFGYDKDQAVRLSWFDKAVVIQELNASCRYLLQTLGTQWGRELVGDDVWIRAWKARASKFDCVIADDVRFINEAEAIKEMGGEMWKVVRPSAGHDWSHVSEGALDSWDGFDRILENNGTIKEFRAKIDLAIADGKG
jgi:hypothetical protein